MRVHLVTLEACMPGEPWESDGWEQGESHICWQLLLLLAELLSGSMT